MTNSIQNYLDELKKALKDSDSATIQDALVDAKEHLSTVLEALHENQPELEYDALIQVIEQYGTAEETAAAYMQVERRTFPGFVTASAKKRSPFGHFFGIYADPRA